MGTYRKDDPSMGSRELLETLDDICPLLGEFSQRSVALNIRVQIQNEMCSPYMLVNKQNGNVLPLRKFLERTLNSCNLRFYLDS